jgi:DNA (cytosine-5)-methyltransferase 1
VGLNYEKLWHRLAEKGLKKKDLMELSGISKASIAKLRKNENVNTDVLERVCKALKCDIAEIMEMTSETDMDSIEPHKEGAKRLFSLNSFFAGIGGFDIAFEKQGFRTGYLCEINDFCNRVLSGHWAKVPKDTDICSIKAEDIPFADVWCGGFPCQDISVARGAAERLGLKGKRSGLFFEYASLIEKKQPEVVIIENVAGLFNSNGGRDFGTILQRMNELGYAVAWRLLNSRYFGVPQSRPRVYLCCWRNNPVKAMRVMFDNVRTAKPGNERRYFIEESPHDKVYPKVPKVAYCLAATSGRHTGTDWSRTYVVCQDGVRRMTPREYERLQGFPDDWTLPIDYDADNEDTDTLRYTAVGNAVSVPVVEWIAQRVHNELSSDEKYKFDKDTIQSYVPEFQKSVWSEEKLDEIDFTDSDKSYKWEHAGVAWNNKYISGKLPAAPAKIIPSLLIDLIETEAVGQRYYLTPNAAEGILRRVNNQGRKLFIPLHEALEKLKNRE